jgi:MT0933-like antitoxin protein
MKVIRMAALIAAATAAASKAKEYARENPDKASQTLDKAEAFVAGKAGPKYADKVGKGSDALRSSLGLPKGASTAGAAEGTTGTPPSTVTPTPSAGTTPPTPSAGTTTPASPAGTTTSTGSTTDGSASDNPPKTFDPSI